MIDGQECATTSFYTEKFYEAQDYWSLTRHVFTNYLWYYRNSKICFAPKELDTLEQLERVAEEKLEMGD